ncbi:MAG TPA: PQQ-dependent sugar dehydrogenase, partial [Gemmatimonadales bacterium]|nr:PQQ-dependent sugar dehydrogenase [Gemmatimonadales bacterium]
MRSAAFVLGALGLCCLARGWAHADSLASGGPSGAFRLEPDWVTGTGQTTDLRWLPDGRVVIINRTGRVFVRPAAGGALIDAGSITVNSGTEEQGLLGVAVHPDFASNRELVFYYSATDGNGGSAANRHRVVKRRLSAASMLEPGETVLIDKLRGPLNHNGGALEVGADGLLYIGVGDTGCNSDLEPETLYTPTNYYGTCLSDDATGNGAANGKILRIALDGTIPATNPLVGATNVTRCGASCGVNPSTAGLGMPREAIWAWGFRNPWRIWFD